MTRYRVLVQPSFNRVYTRSAPSLGVAELTAISELALGGRLGKVRAVEINGASFLELGGDEPLSDHDLRVVATASSAYVVFRVTGESGESGGHPDGDDGAEWLAPVAARPLAVFPDDLLTTLKYGGKTNEQFTALMLNLALAAGARGFDEVLAGERVRLLDPLCGRGTTLNQALMYGLDACGVEVQVKELELYTGFLKHWLQEHRVKHHVDVLKLRKGRDRPARLVTINLTRRDEDDPAVKHGQVLELVNDDTLNIRDHVRRSSVDVIVGDLPYGIQHSAHTDTWGQSRNAETLLRDALPVWRTVLRPGGALCLAYNTNMLSPEEMQDLVEASGFAPVVLPEGVGFAHRVDRTIHRDLVLATRET